MSGPRRVLDGENVGPPGPSPGATPGLTRARARPGPPGPSSGAARARARPEPDPDPAPPRPGPGPHPDTGRGRVRPVPVRHEHATPGRMLCWSRAGIAVTRGPVSHPGATVARTRHFRRLDGGWCPAAGRSEPRRASGWTASRCGGTMRLRGIAPASGTASRSSVRTRSGGLRRALRPARIRAGPASRRPTHGARQSCPLHPACPQPRRKPPHEPGRPEIRRILRR